MTDNEIKKALEDLFKLMLHDGDLQRTSIISKALDLIKRQKAEIGRLQDELHRAKVEISKHFDYMDEAKSEAIKEFAERLKEKSWIGMWETVAHVDVDEIDNLVKEMTEVETNQRKEDEGK